MNVNTTPKAARYTERRRQRERERERDGYKGIGRVWLCVHMQSPQEVGNLMKGASSWAKTSPIIPSLIIGQRRKRYQHWRQTLLSPPPPKGEIQRIKTMMNTFSAHNIHLRVSCHNDCITTTATTTSPEKKPQKTFNLLTYPVNSYSIYPGHPYIYPDHQHPISLRDIILFVFCVFLFQLMADVIYIQWEIGCQRNHQPPKSWRCWRY